MIPTLPSHLFLLLLLFCLPISKTLIAADADLVRRSCAGATYPEICLHTLSSAAGDAHNPRDLAQVAVGVSLDSARKASDFLARVKANSIRERGALRDCVEQIGDSMDELRKTLTALEKLRRDDPDFQWEMSNAKTWVSGALANEDTCLDGFKEIEGRVRSDVRQKMTGVGRVTSNALYLISLMEDSPTGT